jgi:hypothetical protein
MARLWTREVVLIVTPEAETGQHKISKLAIRAREGLRKVALGEDQTITGWLEYGGALNEGRKEFASNELFGQWVCDNLPQTERHERAAAMWAAANPSEFATMQVLKPKVRTVRE